MAVELVTGFTGTEHVSSSDDGARQAGTVGTGMYALETVADPLAATLENANTVTVGPGDVLMNGRHVRLTGSTTFAVPVGTQGQRTSNLLVLRYSVAESGVESVEPMTLTGDPSTGTPADPATAGGSVLDGDSPVDMPLYRVVTEGIESGQPERLFQTVPPVAGLGFSDLSGSVSASQLPVVPVSRGGTGMTASPSLLVNLGSTSAAGVFQASPRPGVTGTLPVARGGTGATSADAARSSLGLEGQLGYFKAGRGVVSDMSRDTLYSLAPGTYLVGNNAANSPVPGSYGNLLVGYSAGNRVVAICAFDDSSVWSVVSSAASGNFAWQRIGDQYRSVLQSQTWGDISVTAVRRDNNVTVTVSRWGQGGTAYVDTSSPSTVGQIAGGNTPAQDVRQLIGNQGGVWLLMQVTTGGQVQLQHAYASSGMAWGTFSGTLTYPVNG